MMLGETMPRSAQCGWKAPVLLSLLLGFAALLSLPHALYKEESAINMALAPSAMKPVQPMQFMQPSRAGPFMQQPVTARQPVQVSALTSPDQSEPSPALAKQRRDMIAASLAFAAAGLSGRSWAGLTGDGAEGQGSSAVFNGKPVTTAQVDPPKRKAESYAGSYKDVEVVAKPSTAAKPGSVGAPDALVPALAVGSILLAGVPVLLSPGEKAFQEQRASEAGQRTRLNKARKEIQSSPKRAAWWGQKSAAKAAPPKQKSGFFR